MSSFFTVRLAGLDVGVESRYEFMRGFCRDYMVDAAPVFTVQADSAAVSRQMATAEEPVTPEYAEALQLYREMAEKLPLYDRAVFHGAAIEYGGKAYLFTGPSGIGKTTHISLWRQYFGERVRIINGDKPILRMKDGKIVVYGTPYAGKEGWQCNASAPLGGVCFLSRGRENAMSALAPERAFTQFYQQTYKPYGAAAMMKTVEILRILSTVPCFSLACDISEEAAKASFAALTGTREGEKTK